MGNIWIILLIFFSSENYDDSMLDAQRLRLSFLLSDFVNTREKRPATTTTVPPRIVRLAPVQENSVPPRQELSRQPSTPSVNGAVARNPPATVISRPTTIVIAPPPVNQNRVVTVTPTIPVNAVPVVRATATVVDGPRIVLGTGSPSFFSIFIVYWK